MENNTTQPVGPENKSESQQAGPQKQEPQPPKTPYSSPIDDLKNKISSVSAEKRWAIICYIPIFNLLTCPLVAVRMVNSKFCRFHSRQGLTLFGLWIVTIFVALLSQTLSLMLWGLLIALHIAGAVFAYMKQETKFPVLGDLALKIPEFYLFTFLTGKKFDEEHQQMVEKDQPEQKN
ncbi:MAG: hypothetical protein WC269_01765 [Candidatus Gracilibacteria bacterium]|jgi:uncharacterized membrane protein